MSSQIDDGENVEIPEYLQQWRGLYVREGEQIVEASQEDIEVAKQYPNFKGKGDVVEGRRITIMCRKNTYRVHEEVRVIHVLEVTEAGQEIFIMGPKAVFGEYVDDHLMTPAASDQVDLYNGRVVSSPGVDYNYDITTYSFATPGRHTIYWHMNGLRSNTLELEIVAS